MKKFLLIMLAMVMVLTCLTACKKEEESETADGESEKKEEKHPNFYLVNLTDREWVSVVVAVTTDEKGEEILGKRESLYRGSKYPVYLETISDRDLYDIRCTDTKGETFTYGDLRLYWISKLTMTIDENLQPLGVAEYREGYDERTEITSEGETYIEEESTQSGDDYVGEGYGNEGYSNEGYGNEGYGNEGYSNEGYGSEGYGNEGYGSEGYGSEGYGSEETENNREKTEKSYSFME